MPTGSYTNLDSNKPSGSDTPTAFANDTLANVRALRDMVVTGRVAGFVQSRTTGTGPDAARPQYLTWLNSTLSLGFRMKSTWGGTNNCQQTSVEWEWSSDNGSTWATMGTAQANTFDSNDNITDSTNSGGFVSLVMELWTKVLRLVLAIKTNASNHVGIGTSAPGATFEVKHSSANGGDPETTGSTQTYGIGRFRYGNGALDIGGYANGTTWLQTADATTLAVRYNLVLQPTGGNVGIGTASPTSRAHVYGVGSTSVTPPTASSLGATLTVQDSGSSPGNGGMVMFGANQGYFAAIKSHITDGNNNTRGRLYFCTRNATADSTLTDRFAIFEDGKIYGLGVYTNTVAATNRDVFVDNAGLIGYVSSIRASKTNIANIADIAWLYQLNPVSFQYRKKDADGNYTDETDGPVDFGLIAEDTEPVKANLCFYDIVDGRQELRGVSYSKLIVPMLKAIQEQQQQIEALKAAVAALQGN